MKEKIQKLLESECPDVDFTASDELVTDGILESLTLTIIIAALSIEFGITIPYEDIIEENFNSLDAMAAMVERLVERR